MIKYQHRRCQTGRFLQCNAIGRLMRGIRRSSSEHLEFLEFYQRGCLYALPVTPDIATFGSLKDRPSAQR